MYCIKCGHKNNDNSQFCIKCGQPLLTNMPPGELHKKYPQRPKKWMAMIISVFALTLAVLLLILILPTNLVAGRWYAKNGMELIMLKNGKGMAVMDQSSEAQREHFMYAIEYEEPGYIEGEIYKKDNGESTFYLYDAILEFDGKYFYRQKPIDILK